MDQGRTTPVPDTPSYSDSRPDVPFANVGQLSGVFPVVRMGVTLARERRCRLVGSCESNGYG